jgi:hypothetical protein
MAGVFQIFRSRSSHAGQGGERRGEAAALPSVAVFPGLTQFPRKSLQALLNFYWARQMLEKEFVKWRRGFPMRS